MKKRYLLLFIICFLLLPFNVNAKSIRDFYIDVTVQTNGDLKVKELIIAEYENGFDDNLRFRNSSASSFDGSLNSFDGSDLYNGSGITIDKVGEIIIPSSYDFTLINGDVNTFIRNDNAMIGTKGYYRLTNTYDGVDVRIFNPGNGSVKGYYVEYTLHDMAILHDDVAEFGWNFMSSAFSDRVDHLELLIHLPNNKNMLRAWAHGPLNGNITLINQETVQIVIDNLNANTDVDTRIVFDTEVVKETTKKSNMEAFSSINEVEKKREDQANQERAKARVIYYGLLAFNGLWLIGLGILIFYMYKKYDKEYQSDFHGKYFREFPQPYGPEIVGYLFRKKIDTNELSAAILNLISEKVIKFNEIGKNDYELIYEPAPRNLKESDQVLIGWLFSKMGSDSRVTLKTIKREAKSNYERFLSNYENWKSKALKEANSYHFFESSSGSKGLASVYSIVGIVLAIITMGMLDMILLPLIVLIAGIASIVYFATITKRTKEGNNDYARWKGLKNFINDFGSFEAKDLPQIVLWEKYLVYATVFGLATKLSKTMKIKFEEMPQSTYTTTDMLFDIHYFNMMMSFNRVMNTSMNNAVSSAISTRSAATSSNSSGGFGGGFSSGGGSFGGGRGGGGF